MDSRAALLEILLAPMPSAPTALQESQGPLYPFDADAQALSQQPINPGFKDAGWENPYRMALYPVTVDTVLSGMACAGNRRRTYLVINNKGPGNLFVNFGQAADALNSITLVPSQQWELTGGAEGGAFVPRDSIYLLTDVAGTTATIGEGVSVPPPDKVH